jgi:hypothetical protein
MQSEDGAGPSSPVGRRAFLGLAPKLAGAALLGGLLAGGTAGCVGAAAYLDYYDYSNYSNYVNYSNYANYFNSAVAGQGKGTAKPATNPAD